MNMLICSGTSNKDWFKCDERKCKHRKLHKPIKGQCGVKDWNGSDRFCHAPDTVSPIDGNLDGRLVTCMTVKELKKERAEFNQWFLKELQESKKDLKQKIQIDNDSLKILDKQIEYIKRQK